MTFHLSAARECRRIRKIVLDNAAGIGTRTENVLQLIRDLLKVAKPRFISGRPRIRRPGINGLIQLHLPFFVTWRGQKSGRVQKIRINTRQHLD